MGDRIYASITIEGPVDEKLLPALGLFMSQEGFFETDTEILVNTPEEAVQMLKAWEKEHLSPSFFDPETRWGSFEGLETFLEENNIAFIRFTEPAFPYNGTMVVFNPHSELVKERGASPRLEFECNSEQVPMISIEKALEYVDADNFHELRQQYRQFNEPMPVFTIVEGGADASQE